MKKNNSEHNQYVPQSDAQFAPERSRPQDWRVERVTNPGHGQYSEPESDQKSKMTGKGLEVNHRVLKHENKGNNGVFSRVAGKKTK